MLSILNEDSLLLICKYLNVYDHIALASTSPHLAFIIQESYRSGSIETDATFWQYCEDHEAMFNEFWRLTSVNLQKLVLEPKQESHLNLLSRCNLPKLKYFSFSLVNLETNMQADALKTFLATNCKNLQHLTLKDIYWNDFRTVLQLRFPELTHLELITKHNSFKLTEEINGTIFPKLNKLILSSVTTGVGLSTLTNLTELALETCTRLLPQCVEQILLKCPLKKLSIVCTLDFHNENCTNIEMQKCYKAISACETLEDLTVDYHYYCMFESELLKLKKLRKFHFLPPSYCLCSCKAQPMSREIIEHFGNATKTLTFKFAQLTQNWHALETFINSLTNVECLKIIFTTCKSEHIRTLAKMLSKSLKEFYFSGFLEWAGTLDGAYCDYSGLLNVLDYCKNIEVFDFSKTFCNERFFNKALDKAQTNFEDRKSPLLFRFTHTPIDINKLKKLQLPDFLMTSNEDTGYTLGKVGIQCEW